MKRAHKNKSRFLVWFVAAWLTLGIIAIAITQCSINKTPDRIDQKSDYSQIQKIKYLHERCATIPLPKGERLTDQQTYRIFDLIKKHPIEEIRTTFFEKIINGDVCLGQRIYGKDNALFKPIPTVSNYIPFIFVRDSILSKKVEWFAQLVIYHEYVHYKHWLEGRLGNETEDPDKIANETSEIREEYCKKIWYTEVEAYQKECALARKLGTATRLAYCGIDLSSHTFPLIGDHVIEAHARQDVCTTIWKELD